MAYLIALPGYKTAHGVRADCECRFVGVADIASVRFSLPAQLLEPTPNLGTTYLITGGCGTLIMKQNTGTIWTGRRLLQGTT